ncbi:MAG TPA: polyprenyl synthetase family protein [Clostridia bacterium]|nr:polyprenyl synthetase family protein [Clostridia bacterium]
MDIDFEKVLKEKRELVWQEIQKYLKPPQFPGKIAIPTQYQKEMDFHWQMVCDYPQRQGKYLRPTLVLLTAEAMGVAEKKAIKTAAAMQTSEEWILIHDDWEDDSLQRRGKPALHRLYSKELANNAGDALHVIMWKMLWDNRQVLGERKAAEIAGEFYQMLTRTVFGQTVEIKWTQGNRQDLSDEDIFLILDGKTSYYTIAGPMRLGAIIGGATSPQLEAIWEFGQYLGRCFQIVDDLLDLTSDFQGLKKQTGNDIYEGKRTIMLAHLLRTIRVRDRVRVREILEKGREEKTVNEVKWVIEKMKELGSLDYGRRIAEDLATKALEIFEEKLKFLSCQPARRQLKSGIDFILERQY